MNKRLDFQTAILLVKENRSNLHHNLNMSRDIINGHDSLGRTFLTHFLTKNASLYQIKDHWIYINAFIIYLLGHGYIPSLGEINISKRINIKEKTMIRMRKHRGNFKLFSLFILREKTGIDELARNIVEFIP